MTERNLDALLSQVSAPPLPAGFADRVAAAATALPQEGRPAPSRRSDGRDRRGPWLRRPLIGAAIALGLAFSGAVAATLAGVQLPSKVAAVIAHIPYVGGKAAEPDPPPARHAAAGPARRPAAARHAQVEGGDLALAGAKMQPRPGAIRRMLIVERIVARREALGLPTPPARQVERMIHRRQMMRRWHMATPEERAAFAANHPRAAAMIEAREARQGVAARQREVVFDGDQRPRARFERRRALRDATPEQREAFFAAHPRARAMMEARIARRAQREGLPTNEPD